MSAAAARCRPGDLRRHHRFVSRRDTLGTWRYRRATTGRQLPAISMRAFARGLGPARGARAVAPGRARAGGAGARPRSISAWCETVMAPPWFGTLRIILSVGAGLAHCGSEPSRCASIDAFRASIRSVAQAITCRSAGMTVARRKTKGASPSVSRSGTDGADAFAAAQRDEAIREPGHRSRFVNHAPLGCCYRSRTARCGRR